MKSQHLGSTGVGIAVAAVLGMVAIAHWREARRPVPAPVTLVGLPGGPTTSRQDLERAIETLRARLAADPADMAAAVGAADALMRQQRVKSDGALAVEAERVLVRAMTYNTGDYAGTRMLAATYLAQHKFKEAILTAERVSKANPGDAWNYGAIGDAYLELGEYEEAFGAFDRMMKIRPSASGYARVAYAQELQGDLGRALTTMRMAADATTPRDPESQAWHYTQIGQLLLQMGRIDEATLEFQHAAYTFPEHPYAQNGLARVKAVRGDIEGALGMWRAQMKKGPTPELAAHIGDALSRLGRTAEAEQAYQQAETLEREGWKTEEPQPAALARFLAERDRKIPHAVTLAEQAASARRDIHTMDALAWSYFKAGRLDAATAAARQAIRTGTRDRRILYHAAAILEAAGEVTVARKLVAQAIDELPDFDILQGPAAQQLALRLGPNLAAAR